MGYRRVMNLFYGARCVVFPKRNWGLRFGLALYNCSGETQEQVLPLEWYGEVFPKIEALTRKLRNVDSIDGILVNVDTDEVIIDDRIKHKMHTLKTIVRVFVGCPLAQRKLGEKVEGLSGEGKCGIVVPFSRTCEREAMLFKSLAKVGDFLDLTSQQRKFVRATICPQVTQHRIWAGALEMVLNGVKLEMDCLSPGHKQANMGQQIVHSCIKLLSGSDVSPHRDSVSWMRLAPTISAFSPNCHKWEDVREMFDDLITFLDSKKGLFYHIEKLEVMKEGLYQIRDVLIDKGIGYKEARHQESLIQKKLSKTLGYPSRCLFTLVLYYLFRHVRDVEVDMRGGMYGTDGGEGFRVLLGRILTSDEEKMVWNGVKQLDRALGLLKFIWQTAGRKESLEMEGHLWCVGAEDRTITYRGNSFFLHGISL